MILLFRELRRVMPGRKMSKEKTRTKIKVIIYSGTPEYILEKIVEGG